MMNIEERLLATAGKVEHFLGQILTTDDKDLLTLYASMRYSTLAGGKRIRPFLTLSIAEMFGASVKDAIYYAAALEMVHTYSLIHDDLPCMDNDDFRRGRPSCHKQFGESTALLAGDTLLTEAFNVASKTIGIDADRVVKAITVLAASAGVAGMIGGQVIDLDGEKSGLTDATRLEMYRLKTGALIKAAAQIGCILAGGSEEDEENAIRYGENLGIAFQIIDDILDKEGDEALLGKPIGSDSKNEKVTIVDTIGIEKSRALAKEFTNGAISALECFEGNKEILMALTEYLLVRNF